MFDRIVRKKLDEDGHVTAKQVSEYGGAFCTFQAGAATCIRTDLEAFWPFRLESETRRLEESGMYVAQSESGLLLGSVTKQKFALFHGCSLPQSGKRNRMKQDDFTRLRLRTKPESQESL